VFLYFKDKTTKVVSNFPQRDKRATNIEILLRISVPFILFLGKFRKNIPFSTKLCCIYFYLYLFSFSFFILFCFIFIPWLCSRPLFVHACLFRKMWKHFKQNMLQTTCRKQFVTHTTVHFCMFIYFLPFPD
jgi:hypothetical protein